MMSHGYLRSRVLTVVLSGLGLLATGDRALADTPGSTAPSGSDAQRALSLFEKARLLRRQGKTDEACALFAESERLDRNGGTLMNLAECHEAAGKTGSAWRDLHEALALAKTTGDEALVKAIRDKLSKIVPSLVEIQIHIPSSTRALAGFSIEMDGERLLPENLAPPIVVDPGRHTVHAAATGHVDFHYSVTLGGKKRKATVEVTLEPIVPPPPPPNYTPFVLLIAASGAGLVAAGSFAGVATNTKGSELPWAGFAAGALVGIGFGVAAIFVYPRSPAPPPAPGVTRRAAPAPSFAVRPMLVPGAVGAFAIGTF